MCNWEGKEGRSGSGGEEGGEREWMRGRAEDKRVREGTGRLRERRGRGDSERWSREVGWLYLVKVEGEGQHNYEEKALSQNDYLYIAL